MRVFIPLHFLLIFLTACGIQEKDTMNNHANHLPKDSVFLMENTSGVARTPDTLKLESQLRSVANLHTQLVRRMELKLAQQFSGTVSLNEQTIHDVTTRVPGRIDKLYYRSAGTFIKKNVPIYGIYSEPLMADIANYIEALNQVDLVEKNNLTTMLAESARRKLVVWGISEADINSIKEQRQVPAWLSFHSPTAGYISEVFVQEGEFLQAGSPVLRVANLRTLWIETIVYAQEINFLQGRSTISVTFEEVPEKVFTGKIIFNNPSLEPNQKINLVRIQIDNQSNLIKPGMMASVNIEIEKKMALIIPKSSLIKTANMDMVWVETDSGLFERRTVTTGLENRSEVEITSGLQVGEQVVTSGGYLLNSEFVIRKGANKVHIH